MIGASSNRPLNVLAYADSEGWSGAEKVFRDVVAGLAAIDGFAVSAAVPFTNGPLWSELESIGEVRIAHARAHRAIAVPAGVWDPRRAVGIRRLIASQPWDAAIVNLPGVEYGTAPLVWARSSGVPLVAILHLHQPIQSIAGGGRLARLRDAVARPILRGADRVLVVSPNAPAEVERAWGIGGERCAVLRLAFRPPAQVDRATARRQLGLPPDSTAVGIIGRVEIRQKGHDVFVEAACDLAASDPSMRFVVVGAGPDRHSVQARTARCGLAGRFHFVGELSSSDAALAALDAIAIPSRFEGLPLVALEALYARLPGVASRVDGLAAIWPRQWTVEPGDAQALAAVLRQVLASPADERVTVLRDAADRAGHLLSDDMGAEVASAVRWVIRRAGGASEPR